MALSIFCENQIRTEYNTFIGVYSFSDIKARLIPTEESIEAGVAEQRYGVIMVPEEVDSPIDIKAKDSDGTVWTITSGSLPALGESADMTQEGSE